jgi:hypothetical protein
LLACAQNAMQEPSTSVNPGETWWNIMWIIVDVQILYDLSDFAGYCRFFRDNFGRHMKTALISSSSKGCKVTVDNWPISPQDFWRFKPQELDNLTYGSLACHGLSENRLCTVSYGTYGPLIKRVKLGLSTMNQCI